MLLLMKDKIVLIAGCCNPTSIIKELNEQGYSVQVIDEENKDVFKPDNNKPFIIESPLIYDLPIEVQREMDKPFYTKSKGGRKNSKNRKY